MRWHQRGFVASLRLACLAGLAIFGVGCSSDPNRLSGSDLDTVFLDQLSWRIGDDPNWARPTISEAGWLRARFTELKGQNEIFWFRAEIELGQQHATAQEPLALMFSALATCELFWDGEPLPSRGRAGATRATETPAEISSRTFLPPRLLAPGSHLIAGRCSTHHRQLEPMTGFYALAVGPYQQLTDRAVAYSWTAMASLSAKWVTAVYFLAMFFLRRDRSYLLLALFSLSASGLLIAEAWRTIVGYTYDWHFPRLWIITACAAATCFLLLTFFLARFPGRGSRTVRILGLSLPLLGIVVVPYWDMKVAVCFLFTLGLTLFWSVLAIRRHQPGSAFAGAGVALCSFVYVLGPQRFLDQRVFFALDGLIALLLVAQAVQTQQEAQRLDRERLHSARLEAELLKRSIQPHFLLNTLTALAEWFERRPEVASEMLESLAEEVRWFDRIADKTTIPFSSELALCRNHLEVMGFRRNRKFRIEMTGIDPLAPTPPGIVHTLLENALTHNHYSQPETVFHLEAEAESNQITYRFRAPLVDTDPLPTGKPSEGTGLRYVRTRLAESFGDAASLVSRADGDQWLTEWTVPLTATVS